MTRLTVIITALFITLLGVTGCTSNTEISQSKVESQTAANSEEHEYSVQIEGSEIKKLSIRQIATMWEINDQGLLDKIVAKFDLKNKYTTDSVIDDLRKENKFSPAMIKEIAESMKKEVSN